MTDFAAIQARWPGRAVRLLAETASTNDVAKAAARAGEPAGLVVIADRQTAGRGRGGHAWHSPSGQGLYLSALVTAGEQPVELPIVAAVAVAEALASIAPGLSIKWPNDVVTPDGRKVAGILCEAIAAAAKVVIGVGVNVAVAFFPAELEARAVSLHSIATGHADRTEVATRILESLDSWREVRRERGFGAIRAAFLERTSTIGKEVECEGVRGVAVGLSAECALEVRRADGAIVLVHAGDVVAD